MVTPAADYGLFHLDSFPLILVLQDMTSAFPGVIIACLITEMNGICMKFKTLYEVFRYQASWRISINEFVVSDKCFALFQKELRYYGMSPLHGGRENLGCCGQRSHPEPSKDSDLSTSTD